MLLFHHPRRELCRQALASHILLPRSHLLLLLLGQRRVTGAPPPRLQAQKETDVNGDTHLGRPALSNRSHSLSTSLAQRTHPAMDPSHQSFDSKRLMKRQPSQLLPLPPSSFRQSLSSGVRLRLPSSSKKSRLFLIPANLQSQPKPLCMGAGSRCVPSVIRAGGAVAQTDKGGFSCWMHDLDNPETVSTNRTIPSK